MNDSTTYFISAQREILITGEFLNTASKTAVHERGEVTCFSEKSRRRLRSHLRNSIAEYKAFITLTYPPGYGVSGEICKRDLKAFLERLKRVQTKATERTRGNDGKPWSVCWFQEWQKNGRLHFHLCATHTFPKEWLSIVWYEVVGSQNEDHLKAGTQIKDLKGGRRGMCKYASKYCSKADQKVIPKDFGWAGRFWGVWGNSFSMAAAITWTSKSWDNPPAYNIINAVKRMLKRHFLDGNLEKIGEKGEKGEFKIYKYKNSAAESAIPAYLALAEAKLLLLKSGNIGIFSPGSALNQFSAAMTTNEAVTDFAEMNVDGNDYADSLC